MMPNDVTNSFIHAKLAFAADAISRARDDLKERDKQTVVSIYSLTQMATAVEYILKAYKVAMENSIICDADLTALMKCERDLRMVLKMTELFPDVVEPYLRHSREFKPET
jgi:hypothetical protein